MKPKKSKAPKEVFRARSVCPSVKLNDEQATIIGEELRERWGAGANLRQIPAKELVEHARSKESAMHGIIWGRNDKDLAYEARCTLARQVVNSIRIEFVDDGETHTKQIAVHVKVNPESKRGYVPVDEAVQSEYMSEQVYQRALSRLGGWLDEFRAFRHGSLGPVWDAVNAVVQQNRKDKKAA